MVIILMGVTGSGKTTVGEMLAAQLGWEFCDADSLHPPANVGKMRRGIPLTDEDRYPWLDLLSNQIRTYLTENRNAAMACSALKATYRERLLIDEAVKLVYLKGSFELIQARLLARRGHYMNPNLLESQFATLEEPKDALSVDISPQPETIIASIRKQLNL